MYTQNWYWRLEGKAFRITVNEPLWNNIAEHSDSDSARVADNNNQIRRDYPSTVPVIIQSANGI